jgi:chromosome segregation ATPase
MANNAKAFQELFQALEKAQKDSISLEQWNEKVQEAELWKQRTGRVAEELEKATATVQALHEEKLKMIGGIEELQKNIHARESAFSAEHERIMSEVETLKKAKNETDASLINANASKKKLEDTVSALKLSNNTLQTKGDSLTEELACARRVVEEQVLSLSRAEDKHKSTVLDLQTKYACLEKEKIDTHKHAWNLSEELRNTEKSLSKRETECSELHQRLEQVTASKTLLEASSSEFVTRLQGQLRDCATKLEFTTTQLQSLQSTREEEGRQQQARVTAQLEQVAQLEAMLEKREQQLAASLAAAEDAQSQLRVVRDSTAAAAARQKGEADAAASAMAREMAVLRGELQVSDAAMAHTCTLTLLCRVHRL